MKIIDAFWEKRNLGVDVLEIELEKKDVTDVNEVLSRISEIRVPGTLIYIKIPVGALELLHVLEDTGFRFLENQLKLSRSLKDYEPPEEMKTLLENTSIQIIEKSTAELQSLLDRITPGMFATDRICLDPLWGSAAEELAANRYKNWIKDIFFKEDIVAFHSFHYDHEVSFGIARVDSRRGIAALILGGAFKGHSDHIAPVTFMNAPLTLFKQYLQKVETYTSVNNSAVCRLYSMFNYKIIKTVYVLRYFM